MLIYITLAIIEGSCICAISPKTSLLVHTQNRFIMQTNQTLTFELIWIAPYASAIFKIYEICTVLRGFIFSSFSASFNIHYKMVFMKHYAPTVCLSRRVHNKRVILSLKLEGFITQGLYYFLAILLIILYQLT